MHLPHINKSRSALRLSHIHKRFGAVLANEDVNLHVAAASIHGIVGENGAGKSTLMSILYGYYSADSGSIEIEGQRVQIKDSHAAIDLGIGMVHQHFMLVENLSALDNILLGVESSTYLPHAQRDARTKLQALMQETGLRIDLDAEVEKLSVGDRQRLEILKALHRGANILILDEPTAVLTAQETEALFVVLRQLRSRGKTILLITHKLKEVLSLCDRVTVMRQGRVVFEQNCATTTVNELAEHMVGRKLRAFAQKRLKAVDAPIYLRIQDLSLQDGQAVQAVQRLTNISLELRSGEILGVAGVAGNGQSELLDVLAGLRRPSSGQMQMLGESFKDQVWLDPLQARALGLAHVPEDRHARGLVLPFAAWESGVLGYERLKEFTRGIFLRSKAMLNNTASLMQNFDVRPQAPNLRSSKFSGGNQQKLILAREFKQSPKILLVGQPTRGVDIGAIEFIHEQLRALRDAGCAMLLVSTELEEILALSDRVIVMNQGRITGELPVEECDEIKLGLLMVSQENASLGVSP